MCRRKVVVCLRLGLLVAALSWSIGLARAQKKTPAPGGQPGPTTITDVAGRKHVRHPRITDTQRKAVAARMKAARFAAAQKGK